MFKIGTLADWFGVGLIEGIRQSQICGATGVQIYAWNELDPQKVTLQQVELIKKTARDCGQEITALCAELGGHGLELKEGTEEKLDYLRKTVELARELNCGIITTHIGIIPEDPGCDTYQRMQESCRQIGDFAKERGAVIAVETGPEPVKRLCSFLDGCGSGMAVNYDPANLVMVTCDDEVEGVYTAAGKIVHTHAKDGICNFNAGCETVYGIFADGGIEALNSISTYFTETPLGQGHVRWIPYLKALMDVGYDGYLTIERETGKEAGNDILLAVNFLKEQLKREWCL